MSENNTKQKKPRQKFSPQFKDQAIERAAKDGSCMQQATGALMVGNSYANILVISMNI